MLANARAGLSGSLWVPGGRGPLPTVEDGADCTWLWFDLIRTADFRIALCTYCDCAEGDGAPAWPFPT